jgi:hypothetical protein
VTKNNFFKVLGVVGLGILLIGSGMYLYQQYKVNQYKHADQPINICRGETCPKPKHIPETVLQRKQQLLQNYGNIVDQKILYCLNSGKEIYRVSGGGGFTVEIFFYDSEGKDIAIESLSDVVPLGGYPESSVNLSGYQCTEL